MIYISQITSVSIHSMDKYLGVINSPSDIIRNMPVNKITQGFVDLATGFGKWMNEGTEERNVFKIK